MDNSICPISIDFDSQVEKHKPISSTPTICANIILSIIILLFNNYDYNFCMHRKINNYYNITFIPTTKYLKLLCL